MSSLETSLISSFGLKVYEMEDVLEKILEEENLITGVKKYFPEFLARIAKKVLETQAFVFNFTSKEIEKMIREVENEKDEFLRDILLAIIYFDYWKIRYFEEGENFYKKILENIDAIFYQAELTLWALLYLKNRKKTAEYKEYIYELIEKLREKTISFIPEDDFLSESEKKETEKRFEECVILEKL